MARPAFNTADLAVEDFRQALRRLAGGVTVVASRGTDGLPRGIVMTAVMSLSFDPPSMLIAVNRNATLLPALTESGIFSINMVDSQSEAWCNAFFAAEPGSRFKPEDWDGQSFDAPVLRDAAASVVCEVDQAEPFGSHMVIRGLVREATFRHDRHGLIYLDGRYARPDFCC